MTKAIQTTGLVKAYKTRKTRAEALNGIDISVDSGDFCALIGPDGAGKTTLIKILCGMIGFDSGKVRLLNLELPGGTRELKKSIAYLSQRFSLYGNLTVEENVTYFARIFEVQNFRARMDKLLEAMNLEAFRDRLAKQLSGGMKQKLGVVCGLIHSPKILFLDEPTTGVDPVSRRELFRVIEEMLDEGLTVFMSTAYMDEAERAHSVYMMDGGRIIDSGTFDSLSGSSGCTVYSITPRDSGRFLEEIRTVKGVRFASQIAERVRVIAGGSVKLSELVSCGGGEPAPFTVLKPTMEDLFINRVMIGASVD